MNHKTDRKWSLFIRLSHWFVSLGIITNLFILEEGDPPHRYLGYTIVVLVFVRLIYGLKKNDHTSIKKFPLSINNLKNFIVDKINYRDTKYDGHNPMASLVYVLMWILVFCLGISGFMMGTDYFFGDEWLEEIHELFSILMQILIISHFVGMAIDSIQFKRKAWIGMFKG